MKVPERYLRNQSTISAAQQERLAACRVLVVGAGGLGSHVLEGLVRLGVGRLDICDPDVTEASNLNRQLLVLESTLGRPKVELARERAALVNSDVEVRPWQEAFPSPTLVAELPACDAVIDCLDSIAARQTLETCCHAAGLPLVYCSIAGLYVYFGVSTPEAPLLAGQQQGSVSLEKELGAPYPTVAIAAGLELELALCLLLDRPAPAGLHVLDLNDFTLDTL